MNTKKVEICINCDAETGNAGIHDGSLWPELSIQWGALNEFDLFGPICNECYEAMDRLKMIYHEKIITVATDASQCNCSVGEGEACSFCKDIKSNL